MAKGVSPEEETTGKLTVTYLVFVSVEAEEQVEEASRGLEAPLRRVVEESRPVEAGCVEVKRVTSMPPPPESRYTGWAAMVTVAIDLTAWRRDLGLTDGRYAAVTVRDLLADADLTATDARLDRVEIQLMAHSAA